MATGLIITRGVQRLTEGHGSLLTLVLRAIHVQLVQHGVQVCFTGVGRPRNAWEWRREGLHHKMQQLVSECQQQTPARHWGGSARALPPDTSGRSSSTMFLLSRSQILMVGPRNAPVWTASAAPTALPAAAANNFKMKKLIKRYHMYIISYVKLVVPPWSVFVKCSFLLYFQVE